MISIPIVALVLVGHWYLYRMFRPWLEQRLGRGAVVAALSVVAALMGGALTVVWLDNAWPDLEWLGVLPVRRVWGRWGVASQAVSYAAGIWVGGSAAAAVALGIAALLRRKLAPAFDPQRRALFHNAALATSALVPFGAVTYGTLLARTAFELREVNFPLPDLPADLEGLRIALVTDIHFGPYLTGPELDRAIDMANEARPQLTLVTGDLITRTGDPLDGCLARLARLRADAGVFGCMGNHEIYADCEDLAEARARALGMDFLRRRSRLLQFGSARLNLVGVDYQRQRRPYLARAGRLIQPGAVNLLMSHNPDVFPVAADLGYDLVVGGHTHGGQVTVEILEQTLNIGRFFTPFVAGLYRRGRSSLYVSRGIGTINLPMRLGARPEVSLLRLRRA